MTKIKEESINLIGIESRFIVLAQTLKENVIFAEFFLINFLSFANMKQAMFP